MIKSLNSNSNLIQSISNNSLITPTSPKNQIDNHLNNFNKLHQPASSTASSPLSSKKISILNHSKISNSNLSINSISTQNINSINHQSNQSPHQINNNVNLSPNKKSKLSSNKSSLVIRIPIQPGHCLVFGRKPDLSSLSNDITPKSILSPICLPKSFTHASRTHCLCTLIAPPLGGLNIRIVVKGQNGLMVDGERFEQGSSAGVELERRDGEQIELGFYGGKKVECFVKLDDQSIHKFGPRSNHQTSNQPFSISNRINLSQIVTNQKSKRKKLNDSSQNPISSSSNNIQSDTKPFISPINNIKTPISNQIAQKSFFFGQSPIHPFSNSSSKLSNLSTSDQVRSFIESLNLDLIGLISSAIVFSPRATVSTTEVIRAALETQPSLAEAVLSTLPLASSSRSSPQIFDPIKSSNKNSELEIKNHRECLSAPLPSNYNHHLHHHRRRHHHQHNHHRDRSVEAKPTELDLKPFKKYDSEGDLDQSTAQIQASDDKIDKVINACRPVILEALQNNWRLDGLGMFGCVTNEGLKDASGEPLEALWYYQPQNDTDLERRNNLQPYVRHVRHTQTTSKQYFFKRVRGSGRRKT
ncbi:hypothetical protein O181_020454 [Austropuccinia psidii MF-1]|uniref:FHA domain-containing protein n=1 Tax=Austropuccinia psidii MF-1 TaxID=1389203 RepID=A0A9Q3CBA5_9BASI|nr:hypothetical protein [Austropuccinia psidii MF-1]